MFASSLLVRRLSRPSLSAIRFHSTSTAVHRFVPTSGTYPAGFLAGSIHVGVKPARKTPDLTLITSPAHPCAAAAVFTQNVFAAAPVVVSRKIVKDQAAPTGIRALVVNSGCANACTGDQGLADAWKMVKAVDSVLGVEKPGEAGATLVMSTGVIGQPLPIEKIIKGVKEVGKVMGTGHDQWLAAAQGIMTTDTFPKLMSASFELPNGAKYRIAGWCKGAGMIHPNMATMLSAIFTDLSIPQPLLDQALKHAADRSFNAISVDGDTSTNDTFVLLANGAANTPTNPAIVDDPSSPAYKAFVKQITEFASALSKLIVRDGEGATMLVDIIVKGGASFTDSQTVARSIATSPLVKTAFHGRDANWGRIVCAVGYSGVSGLDPLKVNLRLQSGDRTRSLHLFRDGAPFDVNEEVAADILKADHVAVEVDLGMGVHEASVATCDFSAEYVKINGSYRS